MLPFCRHNYVHNRKHRTFSPEVTEDILSPIVLISQSCMMYKWHSNDCSHGLLHAHEPGCSADTRTVTQRPGVALLGWFRHEPQSCDKGRRKAAKQWLWRRLSYCRLFRELDFLSSISSMGEEEERRELSEGLKEGLLLSPWSTRSELGRSSSAWKTWGHWSWFCLQLSEAEIRVRKSHTLEMQKAWL